tara:strand:+ start:207 stop:1268 length:1062 start_codon:yes stop_codon:yes gene_type:complete
MFLKKKLAEKIASEGPLSISKFMEICLWDCDAGYYSKKQIIGKKGDFITSPELSQTFGELIGIWSLSYHLNKFKGKKITLLELGPGKGTLVSDALRAIRKIRKNKIEIEAYLLEKSSVLQSIQKKKLMGYNVKWINNIEKMPARPLIIIANEFFDALPINQYVKVRSGWRERKVAIKNNDFYITLDKKIMRFKTNYFDSTPIGGVIEYSFDSIKIISVICEHIKKFGSIALIIDYGETFGFGDTLQAIRSHTPEFILDNPGESDLSSHINFSILAKVALERDLFVSPIIEQFKFLKNLGIENRLDQLIKLNTEKKIESEINGIKKLIDPESMGTLFKVLAIFDSKGSNIEGFS